VDELTLPQQAGEKRFASRVQLLRTTKGDRLVRFAYSTDGADRRGPVTLRERDIARLKAALVRHPALAEVLGSLASSAGASARRPDFGRSRRSPS
jgi:hypothetical protein